MTRLNFFCVETGNYLGRGREYVQRLWDGVDRWRPHDIEIKFHVITDEEEGLPPEAWPIVADPRAKGWWNILACFRPHTVPDGERCMYWDLDQIAVGSLADLMHYDGGFAMLRDFYYPARYADGVMCWRAGEKGTARIWDGWLEQGRPMWDGDGNMVGGSQWWIECAMRRHGIAALQDLFPGQIVSYKRDCGDGLPDGARVLVFHGQPRPHETGVSWVDRLWRAP